MKSRSGLKTPPRTHATQQKRRRPVRETFGCLMAAAFLASPSHASTVTVDLTIDKLQHLNSGPLFNNFYARGAVASLPFQTPAEKVPEGSTVNVGWSIKTEVDPNSLPSYDVPIGLAVLKRIPIGSDNFLDISPDNSPSLNFTYNLQSGQASISSPQVGSDQNRGRVWFSLSSDPLVYEPSIASNVTALNDAYLFRYDFLNDIDSHYDITSILFPDAGLISFGGLAPGEVLSDGFITTSAIKGYNIVKRQATVYFGDPGKTTRLVNVLVPAPIPLPAGMPLLVGGVLMLGFLRRHARQ